MTLRQLEKMLDSILRHSPPKSGRRWREASADGLWRACTGCGVKGRAWVGSYSQAIAGRDPRAGRHLCSSGPLCAVCASHVQRCEASFPIEDRAEDMPHVPC